MSKASSPKEGYPVPVMNTVAPANVRRAVAVMTSAFSADPVCKWAWRNPGEYSALFPLFVHAFGGRAFTEDTAYQVNDCTGVALWLAPGVEPDEEALAASLPAERATELGSVFEQMASYHPHEPHWYLPLIGVAPTHQGQGYGTALLRNSLRRIDDHHLASYLESTNPRNNVLYQRFGFKLLGTIEQGSMPPIYPMLRSAR